MDRRSFLEKLGICSAVIASPASSSLQPLPFQTPDWEVIRKQFPLNTSRAYFNNGTFGPSPYPVLNSLTENFMKINQAGEYGSTKTARERIAQFIGCEKSEISLTHNTTEGINVICAGLQLHKGDEVIISLQEHVGNALPWIYRSKKDGIILKTFQPASTKAATIQRIKNLITRKTRVIAIPHITCTTGQVLPISEIGDLAKKKKIFTAIDGAHGAGMLDLDIQSLNVDFYASCCHKWMLGPGGTGFLYVNDNLLDVVSPTFVGAYSDTGWELNASPPYFKGFVPSAHRYDFGTQSSALYSGVSAAVDFHMGIGKNYIESRIKNLSQIFLQGLLKMPEKYSILTPQESDSRAGMITFLPKKMSNVSLNKILSKEGFRLRLVPESDLDAIRASFHIYNSESEIDSLLSVLRKV
jgi:L-cysteine/cystine lyase